MFHVLTVPALMNLTENKQMAYLTPIPDKADQWVYKVALTQQIFCLAKRNLDPRQVPWLMSLSAPFTDKSVWRFGRGVAVSLVSFPAILSVAFRNLYGFIW